MVQIIAEFCQNHNGDYSILQEMIHQAAEGGATYGKIQTIFPEDLAFRERFEDGLVENGITKCIKRPYKPEFERLSGLTLTYDQHVRFIEDCKKYGLKPMTTCFTRGSISRLAEFDWSDIKVASYDCASLPLLRELSKTFKKIIVSTGATYDEEISQAAQTLKQSGADFSFLHCVTVYPTPLDQIHLNRMKFLKQFSQHVGLSDHTLVQRDGVKAALAAVYNGAEYIERHFTVLAADQSRDGPVSIRKEHLEEIVSFSKLSSQDQLKYLKENVPEYESMLGTDKRDLSSVELLNRDYYRGRFATKTKNGVVYNWEEKPLD